MRFAAVALASLALAGTGHAGRPCPGSARLGAVAYVRDAVLHVFDLGTCRDRVLVAKGVEPPVRFSADGRFLAFGSGRIVATAGGRPGPPLGAGWAWAPRGHLLAAVTAGGGVVVGGRRIVPDGWGPSSLAWSPTGGLVLARSRYPRKPYRQSIWLWTGRLRRVAGDFPGIQTPFLAPASPDGRRLLWWLDPQNSSSIAADGLVLEAVSAAGGRAARLPGTLAYPDFLAWCGSQLVAAAGYDRVSTSGKSLVALSPPRFTPRGLSRDRSRSWISPACSPDGRLVAAAAGPRSSGTPFGHERRSIWLLDLDGSTRRRLTEPPPGRSDELPRWSADGRSLLFLRSGPTAPRAEAEGSLYLVRLDGALLGPIAELGPTDNYYGHYDWARQTDWFRPRVP